MKACIQSSFLWPLITQIRLTSNMRVYGEEVAFSSCLLAVGNGSKKVHTDIAEDIIQIPEQYLGGSIEELIKKVFPQVDKCYSGKYFVSKCTILTLRNENVNILNEQIMDKFPRVGATYRSAKTFAEGDLKHAYPTEFLKISS